MKKKDRIKELEQQVQDLTKALAEALARIPNVNLPTPAYQPHTLPWYDSGIRYC